MLFLAETAELFSILKFHKLSLLPQLAVAGAVVAAGIAIVAGVRGLKKKEEKPKEPETTFEKMKRKVSLRCNASSFCLPSQIVPDINYLTLSALFAS